MLELAGDYLQANRPDLARPAHAEAAQRRHQERADLLLRRRGASALGKVEEGIASIEQAANLEPTNMQVLQSLTQLYMHDNRPGDAERVAKRALTFNANSKDAG